jgi:CBS domain-containing protein
MTTVRQLLDQKGGNTWSIHPDATVFDAVAKMAEKDIGSLVVMEGDEFVGIITERHYARNVVLKGKTSPATPVRDIMETLTAAMHNASRVPADRHTPTLAELHRSALS